MIEVGIYTNSLGELLGFCIKGHAGMANIGQDIVCAAVSSAAYMAANTITDVKNADANIFVDETGEMMLRIHKKYAASCNDILAGFRLHMLSLEEQYPANIKVNYMEV
jgi:uncharacterized protein YsxB (DUF464 family)